jgi:hypothetical protein
MPRLYKAGIVSSGWGQVWTSSRGKRLRFGLGIISDGMKYETIESPEYPGHWHVEAIDKAGCIYVAVFSGPNAQQRAAEYADWINGVQPT